MHPLACNLDRLNATIINLLDSRVSEEVKLRWRQVTMLTNAEQTGERNIYISSRKLALLA